MNNGKYKEWLEPENLIRVQGWARDGLTNEQIAHNIGICVAQLYEWKKLYAEFNDALKKGKEVADYEMENALFENGIKGNVTAQIFWLKNRKPDKWKDTRAPESNNNDNDLVMQMIDHIKNEKHD